METTLAEHAEEMPTRSMNTIREVVAEVGRYPEEAFQFVREGLSAAVERVHGPPSQEILRVSQYMAEEQIDLEGLRERISRGAVDPGVLQAIEAAGGFDKLNRHVSGQDLCWAMRDLALERWGMLARVVLRSWNIHQTLDFGRIVFAMIEHDLMQKQPDDRLDDFEAVYDFDKDLDETIRLQD